MSKAMRGEWEEGLTQWATRRECERSIRRYRSALRFQQGGVLDEWQAGYEKWKDQALLGQLTRMLGRPGKRQTHSQIKRRIAGVVSKAVERKSRQTDRLSHLKSTTRRRQRRSDSKGIDRRSARKEAVALTEEPEEQGEEDATSAEEAAEALQVYLSKDGKQYGPHTIEELQALLDDGQFVAEDLAFYEGCEDWVTVAEVPGLRIKAETTADTEQEVAPEEDLETATREPAKEAKTEERKNGVRPILVLVPLVMLLLGMGGVTVYLLNHVNELEERLSGRLDKWDEDLAFLQEIPEPEEETQGPGETGQTGFPSTPATPAENTTEPTPPPAPPAPKPKPEPAKPDNPNLSKLKSNCSLVIKSLETISAKVGAREFEDEAVKTEQKILLSLLEEFVSHATIIETGASVNGATVVQNRQEVIRVLIFLKKTQSEVSKEPPDSVKTIRALATKLTPYKQSLQTRAGSLVDGRFADYPKGEHVREWTDKGGNDIRGYLWGYAPDINQIALVNSSSNAVFRPTLSELEFSNVDRGYLNAFLAWRESVLATYRDKEPNMVLIKKGKFLMGSAAFDKGAQADEKPQHEVTISNDFYMGKHEVTVGEWHAINSTTYKEQCKAEAQRRLYGVFGRDGNKPQFNLNQSLFLLPRQAPGMILEYCKKLNDRERKLGRLPKGMLYRLPTEAEWEYAFRAGTRTPYFWGTDAGKGQTQMNPWGLYKMIGHPPEALLDFPRTYTVENIIDPVGTLAGTGYFFGRVGPRSADRGFKRTVGDLSFRLVRAKPIKK